MVQSTFDMRNAFCPTVAQGKVFMGKSQSKEKLTEKNLITAAQLFYITRVRPEKVTHEEALPEYEKNICTPHLKEYWEKIAQVVNGVINHGF